MPGLSPRITQQPYRAEPGLRFVNFFEDAETALLTLIKELADDEELEHIENCEGMVRVQARDAVERKIPPVCP